MGAEFVSWPEYHITYAGAADRRGFGECVKFAADAGASCCREVATGNELGSGAECADKYKLNRSGD